MIERVRLLSCTLMALASRGLCVVLSLMLVIVCVPSTEAMPEVSIEESPVGASSQEWRLQQMAPPELPFRSLNPSKWSGQVRGFAISDSVLCFICYIEREPRLEVREYEVSSGSLHSISRIAIGAFVRDDTQFAHNRGSGTWMYTFPSGAPGEHHFGFLRRNGAETPLRALHLDHSVLQFHILDDGRMLMLGKGLDSTTGIHASLVSRMGLVQETVQLEGTDGMTVSSSCCDGSRLYICGKTTVAVYSLDDGFHKQPFLGRMHEGDRPLAFMRSPRGGVYLLVHNRNQGASYLINPSEADHYNRTVVCLPSPHAGSQFEVDAFGRIWRLGGNYVVCLGSEPTPSMEIRLWETGSTLSSPGAICLDNYGFFHVLDKLSGAVHLLDSSLNEFSIQSPDPVFRQGSLGPAVPLVPGPMLETYVPVGPYPSTNYMRLSVDRSAVLEDEGVYYSFSTMGGGHWEYTRRECTLFDSNSGVVFSLTKRYVGEGRLVRSIMVARDGRSLIILKHWRHPNEDDLDALVVSLMGEILGEFTLPLQSVPTRISFQGGMILSQDAQMVPRLRSVVAGDTWRVVQIPEALRHAAYLLYLSPNGEQVWALDRERLVLSKFDIGN